MSKAHVLQRIGLARLSSTFDSIWSLGYEQLRINKHIVSFSSSPSYFRLILLKTNEDQSTEAAARDHTGKSTREENDR